MESPMGVFGTRRILLGEIEVLQLFTFEEVWSWNGGKDNPGATFYKPFGIPSGYFSLGHYCQSNRENHCRGWMLVVKEREVSNGFLAMPNEALGMCSESERRDVNHNSAKKIERNPSIAKPLNYTLVWSSKHWKGNKGTVAYFWLPQAPEKYRACGFVVTNTPHEPSLEEAMCVRSDLTDTCEIESLIWTTGNTNPLSYPFSAWNLRPKLRGAKAPGVCVGTFYCNNDLKSTNPLPVACLKNVNFDLSAMPKLSQMHAIVKKYGPIVFYHPEETYFPSSVSWVFENGELLYKRGVEAPQPIMIDGSNLPLGGSNDNEYWLDLPKEDEAAKRLKQGDLQGAMAYLHFKPALGGTFTDIVAWLFYPLNGSITVKVGALNLPLKYGEHVGDWEHFTLRISNFTGELWKIYFSQHSGGQWINAADLERIEGNRIVVYASKGGHATFPHAGNFLEGDRKLGVGIRNDAARSKYFLDISRKYQIVAAEYLEAIGSNEIITEPPWLQYMREWGPKIVYNSRTELNRVIRLLPSKLRSTIENLLNNMPKELSGGQGPTGPKAKDNWDGDERG
ncbi:hypothetical protein SUGI_1037970 [Cryptomeria japonica]|uniref:hypothetical protein At1g04090 n=1 Tax=Cryptomeria japonica TaxID=3369 RepID=UPI0024149A2B|nr:hypothetical protein At1g04090 [Cryptomeria japonica]GLJ49187.1 hypothetical protein SUGI_1037970 [Cryptomeria japonica]